MNDRERRRHRVVTPSEHPGRARSPRRHRHPRQAGVEERVHRRHVGRDRRGVPRDRVLGCTRRRSSPVPAATSARVRISAGPATAARATETRRRCLRTTSYAMRVLGDVVLAVHDCPIPVVAKVDGVCVGAGLGLALAADMIWCSETARFSAIFAKRGLSLDFGSSWLLRQRIGLHKAKELVFTAADVQRHGRARARARQRGRSGRGARRSRPRDRGLDRRRSADRVVDGETGARQRGDARRSRRRWRSRRSRKRVNVHTEDLREALTAYVRTAHAGLHGPLARLVRCDDE